MTFLLIIGFGAGVLFAVVVFFGSPYVRSHKQPVEAALDLLEISEGDHLVDLGSGDGAILLAAAQRGAGATGYEINPILWAISSWRTRNYRKSVSVKWGDMWKAPIDERTQNLFVFLDARFLVKLDDKIKDSGAKLRLVTYSYKISDKKILKSKNGMHLYEYK